MANHFVAKSCQGEKCSVCKAPATHKVGEEFPFLMPVEEAVPGSEVYTQPRHNFTAYLCCLHFSEVMGPFVRQYFCKMPMEEDITREAIAMHVVTDVLRLLGEWLPFTQRRGLNADEMAYLRGVVLHHWGRVKEVENAEDNSTVCEGHESTG